MHDSRVRQHRGGAVQRQVTKEGALVAPAICAGAPRLVREQGADHSRVIARRIDDLGTRLTGREQAVAANGRGIAIPFRTWRPQREKSVDAVQQTLPVGTSFERAEQWQERANSGMKCVSTGMAKPNSLLRIKDSR
ncbi:MAG: hypothetical protein V9E81_03275 [Marmoricola sp.]